jgi:two-component system, NarL family, nitrate/nitrite response regulator NarL
MQTSAPIRILLVDDHRSILWGLEKLVDSAGPGMRVVDKATCCTEALTAIQKHSPDVIVLDIDLGTENGLDIMPELRAASPAKILVLTGVRDPSLGMRTVSQGGSGLVLKSETADTILRAISQVYAGELWLDRITTAALCASVHGEQRGRAPLPEDELTGRERHIVSAVVKHKGAPNKVIADALHISGHTLRNHLASIYAKLGIHRRLDLVLYAMEHHMDRLPS